MTWQIWRERPLCSANWASCLNNGFSPTDCCTLRGAPNGTNFLIIRVIRVIRVRFFPRPREILKNPKNIHFLAALRRACFHIIGLSGGGTRQNLRAWHSAGRGEFHNYLLITHQLDSTDNLVVYRNLLDFYPIANLHDPIHHTRTNQLSSTLYIPNRLLPNRTRPRGFVFK